jgi:hypothetical protein
MNAYASDEKYAIAMSSIDNVQDMVRALGRAVDGAADQDW